jgi:hypothetical protein
VHEQLVVLPTVHLAAVAPLAEGEVEVVAPETDPVLTGSRRGRAPGEL